MSENTTYQKAVVECLKLGKSYDGKTDAVDNISFSVTTGEVLFITGPSGAGKSTLLKLICRRETPDRGMVSVFGRDIARLKKKSIQDMRRRIGMADQELHLLPKLSAAQNVAMAMELDYRPRLLTRNRVYDLLESLGLKGKEQRAVGELSLGEQQRVAIARAAANYPDLVLADEPTGNLDKESGQLVNRLFEQLAREGATVIVATHDPALYQETERRVLQLQQGIISEQR